MSHVRNYHTLLRPSTLTALLPSAVLRRFSSPAARQRPSFLLSNALRISAMASSSAPPHPRSNRLAAEHSPYLLQHAHNPVDWYPWGDEAFEEARKRNVPIFLSIGYSTCHWCHVMEVESFENEEIAKMMNKWFVSVKVDREERPDVDKVYMTYVQALYGGGGWPLSVFLSPSLKPLMGGTYFPPDDKYGRPGFKTVLRRVKQAWETKREMLEKGGTLAMEHSAHVILYTLLMSDWYLKNDIDSCLLYYIHTYQTLGIKVQRSDLIGLVMRRNEFASELLKASTTQTLPPMLQNLVMCNSCRHLNTCTLYHKAYGGDAESSGLGDMFNNLVGYLTKGHINFLKHWERLIDMEAKVSQESKKEILHPDSSRGEHRSSSLSSMVLDAGNGSLLNASPKNGKFVYNFVCHNWHKNGSEMPSEGKLKPVEPGVSNVKCTLRCGDYVIVSTESGHIAVANGFVCAISHSHISSH